MDGNITGFSAPDSNALTQSGSVQGTGRVQAGKGSSATQSTVERSQLEAIMLMLTAGLPILQSPIRVATSINDLNATSASGVGSASPALKSINAEYEKTKNEIISSMWESFQKNLREFADRVKKQDRIDELLKVDRGGPKSASEYYAYIMTLSATKRENETDSALVVQFNNAFKDWIVNPMSESSSYNKISTNPISGQSVTGSAPGDYPNSSFIVASVATNPQAVREAIGTVGEALGVQISMSPIADTLMGVGPTSGLPADYQAAAALIASLLNGGAVSKATNETIKQAASGNQPPRDLDFAINYAKSIMQIVTHKLENEGSIPRLRAEQNKMVRLMLTTMALNMVYRAAYGGMTGKELADILTGETADISKEIKPLIEQLSILLNQFLPQDPETRKQTIANLMAYVDSKSSVDSMLNTTRLFSGLLNTGDIEYNRHASHGS